MISLKILLAKNKRKEGGNSLGTVENVELTALFAATRGLLVKQPKKYRMTYW